MWPQRVCVTGRILSLHAFHRLATSDGLDAEQPFAVGVPAWLSAAEDGFGRNLFFVQFDSTAESMASSSSMASRSGSVAGAVLSAWSEALCASQSVTGVASLVPQGCDPSSCPIEGLLLGPLLGKGSYGRVYRGVYKGMAVAVKVSRCIDGCGHCVLCFACILS